MVVKNVLPYRQGVFLCLLIGFSIPVLALCPSRSELQWAELGKVVDGDTLTLADGRVLRLVGVNTPELGRDGRPDQALARRARDIVQRFFSADGKVGWVSEPPSSDRYGRLLAEVFDGSKRSLSAELLDQGVAWQVAIPPALGDTQCLQTVEAAARAAGRGVWSEAAYRARPSHALPPDAGGFARVTGEVSRVAETSKGWWIEMPGLSLRLARKHWHYFAAEGLGESPRAWLGRVLEVRGWIINRRNARAVREGGHPPLMIVIGHPRMISLQ